MPDYYLGLSINDDSVGYAVTDEQYHLLKKGSEPLWGVHMFEKSEGNQERRANRSQRRRLARKKKRIQLLNYFFESEIKKIDASFFERKKESTLKTEDKSTKERYLIFNNEDYGDPDFYKQYPTIHHLIHELIVSKEPHDIRLVYLACAWLLQHRGHFYSNVSINNAEEISNIHTVYQRFSDFFKNNDIELPWECDAEKLGEILKVKEGVRDKTAALIKLFGVKFPKKETEYPYNRSILINLLAGGKAKPADLFMNEAYAELKSFSLNSSEEDFEEVLAELEEDDGELINILKGFQDWSILVDLLEGEKYISVAKVNRYNKHKNDLAKLKHIVYTYLRDEYQNIFFKPVFNNYASYTGNTTRIKKNKVPLKFKCSYEDFAGFLKKHLKDLKCEGHDQAIYNEIMNDLNNGTFLPLQITSENRVIPYQLYYIELQAILNNAAKYLPFLNDVDSEGFSTTQKILSIMSFTVPYYVGPTSGTSCYGWIQRIDNGPLYPWKFDQQVDLDASERAFILRMLGKCSYLLDKYVLPKNSLVFCAYNVLNTINVLKINGNNIPVEAKQALYNKVFLKNAKVTVKQIEKFFIAERYMKKDDTLSGIDKTVSATLAPFIHFEPYLSSGILHTSEVEEIILRKTLSQDSERFKRYLGLTYPQLRPEDIQFIASLNYKDYGRLSKEFLCDFIGVNKKTDNAYSILQFMWLTNDNLPQILSSKYTFSQLLTNHNRKAFEKSGISVNARLDDMMIGSTLRRAIQRTMSIVDEISSSMKCPPVKIFIKSARRDPDNDAKRIERRAETLKTILKTLKTSEDAQRVLKELEGLGPDADTLLRINAIYLYFRQLGRCLYTGERISLSRLRGSLDFNIDHIIPKSILEDESVTRNLALVSTACNKAKNTSYPVDPQIQEKMQKYWLFLRNNGLMTNGMYDRLIRTEPLTKEEKMYFLENYIIENSQMAKATKQLLQEKFPYTHIAYAKSSRIREFCNEFELYSSPNINDLHHAKDALLSIVIGNVFDTKFFYRSFDTSHPYTIRVKSVFTHQQENHEGIYWSLDNLEQIKTTFYRNDIHFTNYSYQKKGAFYKATIQKGNGNSMLMPIKKNLDPEKYGGFTAPSCSNFVLAKVDIGSLKGDIQLIFVDLIHLDRYNKDLEFRKIYLAEQVQKICGKYPDNVEPLFDGRAIKIGSTILLNGYKFSITGKSSGGKAISMESMIPFICDAETTKYIKAVERLNLMYTLYKNYQLGEKEVVNKERNLELYNTLSKRASKKPFNLFITQAETLEEGRNMFLQLDLDKQVKVLMSILAMFKTCRPGAVDLSLIGGSANAASLTKSYKLSNWLKTVDQIELIDESPAGIYKNKIEIIKKA